MNIYIRFNIYIIFQISIDQFYNLLEFCLIAQLKCTSFSVFFYICDKLKKVINIITTTKCIVREQATMLLKHHIFITCCSKAYEHFSDSFNFGR